MSHQSVRYSRLDGEERDDRYAPDGHFKSAFTYNDSHNIEMSAVEGDLVSQQSVFLVITSWVLTFLSYAFLVLTAPVSYWILVKKMGEFDRMVVFRLGKMIGVKGPGRYVIFPWMDRTQKIDVRPAAFNVPPQQFITSDGGIVEMGANVQYGIVDVVTMVKEVVDHGQILRSLGKTILVKILVKKSVQQCERDRRSAGEEIQDEINRQVRKWGINVHQIELSDPKILKQADTADASALGSVLRGLGMKEESAYPTPEEFARSIHGGVSQETKDKNMFANITQVLSANVAPSGHKKEVVVNWQSTLEDMLATADMDLEEDAYGLYKLEVAQEDNDDLAFFIKVSKDGIKVMKINESGLEPDVSVKMSSLDLQNLLGGHLAPLQAYLTGRIVASGDVRKLMFLEALSKRGHKKGSTFQV